MDARHIDALLDLFTPHELRQALWYVDVFERWSMPAEQSDEWRRKVLARRRFLDSGTGHAGH